MAEDTAIEWCDSTFNPWTGCTKVSPGCDRCYAEGWAKRSGTVQWGPHAERRRTTSANWRKPLLWNAKRFMQCECGWRGECAAELIGCGACGSIDHLRDVRRRVFCASLADVFDNQVPDECRRDLFELIGRTQHMDWLLLTKRIGNAREMLNAVVDDLSCGINTWDERPWPGVWIGATVVNQHEADRDIPKLLQVPARVRFLSIEPMLGPVTLHRRDDGGTLWIGGQRGCDGAHRHGGDPIGHDHGPGTAWVAGDPTQQHHHHDNRCRRGIDWVICGGESGPGARPMHPDWARNLRDQCAAAGVPFLFKQWGEWHPESSANYGTGPSTYRYGKVEGLSMMPSGAICVRNTADAPAGRPTVVDREALQAWHDRSRRAEGKPDADNYPFGYQWLHRVGKKAAGRLLDGVEHNGFPVTAC